MRVSGGVHSSDCCTVDSEDLAIHYGFLRLARRVLVDLRGQVRVHANEVEDTPSVVSVPMSQEHVGQGEVAGKQDTRDQISPVWNALPRVDNETLGASANDVSVCALQSKLLGWEKRRSVRSDVD